MSDNSGSHNGADVKKVDASVVVIFWAYCFWN